jgi:hypothetical protein
MVETGSLVTAVAILLPLSEARAAHEMLDGIRPKPRGKVVLHVAVAHREAHRLHWRFPDHAVEIVSYEFVADKFRTAPFTYRVRPPVWLQ